MIEIDGIIYSLQRQGGISVYFDELISALDRTDIDYQLALHEGHHCDSSGSNVIVRKPRFLERYRAVRTSSDVGIFHSSYYRRPRCSSGLKQVVTLHDFVYERHTEGLKRFVHSKQKFAALRSADAIICVSQATADDLDYFVGKVSAEIHVVPNGVSEDFQLVSGESLPNGMETPYILYVGQRSGYKNFSRLARALKYLDGFHLICVGGEPFHESELRQLQSEGARKVLHMQDVSNRELNILYNHAYCLTYPSLYEGFGIPVVEAMKAGCPVVCGPCKAVIEVGGDALTIAWGDDSKDLADAVRLVGGDDREEIVKRGLARSKQYSWAKTHEATAEIYMNLLGK
ncbi:glycosyltransferase family 4 protein [Qipengyuania aquimaris]|uniref:Glycosyltransferase family 4 protein n=1 Tax=Qipengyuania aquimaris TaxID=255984 RepID=A0A9Q3XDL7_9SPHN|nr:glycosyltransferase family 1 protein [Qipengyuania aquimaris]MBY6217886.1 glycosyltransferase family 4 protein [Qipengyuania aquimaris]